MSARSARDRSGAARRRTPSNPGGVITVLGAKQSHEEGSAVTAPQNKLVTRALGPHVHSWRQLLFTSDTDEQGGGGRQRDKRRAQFSEKHLCNNFFTLGLNRANNHPSQDERR